MADFWTGFGAGFVPSSNQAADRYQRGLIADQELSLRRAEDARRAAAHDLQMRQGRRVESATENLSNLQRGLPMEGPPTEGGVAAGVRPPTDREQNQAMAQLFAAQGNAQGLIGVRGLEKEADWAEGFKSGIAEWRAMSPQERAAIVDTESEASDVRGYGSYVADKKTGYLHYTAPGKPPVKLTDSEAAQIYAYGKMQAVDPERAFKARATLSDKLQGVLKDMFQAQTQGAQVSNTGTHYAATDANNAARLGIEQSRLGLQKKEADARTEALNKPHWVQVEGPNGLQYFDVNSLKKAPDGSAALPPGLKMPSNRAPMSPLQEAQALENLTNVYQDPNKARRALDVRMGRITPEMVAEAVRSDSREVQLAEVQKWGELDRPFASAVARLLISNAPEAPAASPSRPGLPPPIPAKPGAPPEPMPAQRRGVAPGQGGAVFPWEVPEGKWK